MPTGRALPAEFGVRPCAPGDVSALGELRFASSPPGVACTTWEEAEADICAPWPGTPDCPSVIEVFTAPDRRWQGITLAEIFAAMAAFRDDGGESPVVRVAADNQEALVCGRKLGFRKWRETCEAER